MIFTSCRKWMTLSKGILIFFVTLSVCDLQWTPSVRIRKLKVLIPLVRLSERWTGMERVRLRKCVCVIELRLNEPIVNVS